MKYWLASVLALVMSGAAADDLGRLFFDVAERAELDRMRAAAHAPAVVLAPASASEVEAEPGLEIEPDTPAMPLTVDGIVTRTGGRPTAWINGIDATYGDLSAVGIDASQLGIDAVRVRLPRSGDSAPLVLKPGQRFDPDAARVSEAYELRAPP
jgi:hypothetical protein